MSRARTLADYVSSGDELADKAPLASPVFTGTPTGIVRGSLAADIIDGTKLADDAVDSEHVAADSLDAEHYAAGSVDTTAIADDAVTGGKLSNDIAISTTGNIATTSSGTITSAGLITANGGIEIDTNSKVVQKGAFMQSSTHQALTLGY